MKKKEREVIKIIYENVNVKEKDKDKRVPIYRGCSNETCFCTGRCREVIGYSEDGDAESTNILLK